MKLVDEKIFNPNFTRSSQNLHEPMKFQVLDSDTDLGFVTAPEQNQTQRFDVEVEPDRLHRLLSRLFGFRPTGFSKVVCENKSNQATLTSPPAGGLPQQLSSQTKLPACDHVTVIFLLTCGGTFSCFHSHTGLLQFGGAVL